MKIMILLRALNIGGAQRQAVALARGLKAKGHQVSVTLFYGEGEFQKELERSGIHVHVVGKSGRWDMGGFLLRLMKLLRDENPDILHSYLPVPNILGVFLKYCNRKMRVVCGIRASYRDLSNYDWLHWFTEKVSYQLGRFADLNIVNSYAGAEYAASQGIPDKRLRVIYNGINIQSFKPNSEARERLRAEWGISANDLLIGIVGRLDPMKDHKTFLKVAARLVTQGKHYKFVIVGSGPSDYQAELISFADDLGVGSQVIWAGARDDSQDVYNSFDIFCSSSSYGEGFSNVIGEAMACGVPCVATDVGDSKTILGDLGALSSPGDVPGLVASINQILTRLRYEVDLPLKIRGRIEENFSIEKLVCSTENALAGVIATK